MNLAPIAQYLEDNGAGTQGVDIFINQMQVTDTGLMLKESYRGTLINYELPGYYKTEFAVVARGTKVSDTQAVMQRALALFNIQRDLQLGSMFVKYLRARTLPVSYPIPTSGLQEVVVTIDCCFVLK
jgi:hypothetical protein